MDDLDGFKTSMEEITGDVLDITRELVLAVSLKM